MRHSSLVLAVAPALLIGCGVIGPGVTSDATKTDEGGDEPPSTTGGPESEAPMTTQETTGPASTSAAQTGSTSAASTTTASTDAADTGTGDSTGGPPGLCRDDKWEPNDLPEAPATPPWDDVSSASAYVVISAFLCPGDSDWYRVSVDMLEYEYYALFLDGIVEGSSWCGQGCDDPWLPPAPEHTMGVEVHDATTLELLGSVEAENGRVKLGGIGEPYSRDLLIRVYGPTPAATFQYELNVQIRGYEGEDECEC